MPGRKRTRGRPPMRKKKAATRIQATYRGYRNRRNFRKKLQPFVETKANEAGSSFKIHGDTLDSPPDTAFTLYTPDCFLYKTEGTGDGEIVGDAIYSRYLTTKMLIEFPQDTHQLIQPTTLEIYQVWITTPLGATPYTSFATPPSASERDTVTKNHLESWLFSQSKEFFATKEDRMEFHELLEGIKIVKKVKVELDRNASIHAPQEMPQGNSGPPDWFRSFKWNIKGKEHYQPSSALTGNHTHYMNRPRYGYPALIIYNPNFADQIMEDGPPVIDRRIKLSFNSKHWYGDQ